MSAFYNHRRRRQHPVVAHLLLLLACGGLLLLDFPTTTTAFVRPSFLATTTSSRKKPQQRQQHSIGVLYMSDTTTTSSSPSVPPPARRVPTTSTRPEQVDAAQVLNEQQQQQKSSNYTTGLLIIGFITFLNASTNPLWHSVVGTSQSSQSLSSTPPPLLLNAAVAVVAYVGLVAGGDFLEEDSNDTSKAMTMVDENVDSTTTAMDDESPSLSSIIPNTLQSFWNTHRGGMELGFWKCLGTTSHIYGLSWTTANHGAFLIQLTTLIVPVVQSLQGEVLPNSIKGAVALALLGVYLFTQDPQGAAVAAASTSATDLQMWGDALCVACAFFYSLYDLQTFKWGKQVPRKQLVTTKIGTQAFLSVALCAAVSGSESLEYLQDFVSSFNNPGQQASMWVLPAIILWSGLVVNALATFLQVQGMQFIGPTRAQTIFASQPLWSAALSYVVLGETIGGQGMVGGGAFLAALALAIAAPQNDDSDKT